MKNQPVRFSPRENAAYIGIFFAFLLLNLCASNLYPEEDHITLVSTLLLLLPHVLLWGLFLVLHLCLRRKIRQLNTQSSADFNREYNDLLENRETEYRVRKRRLERLRVFSDLLAGVLLVFGFAFPWLCALFNNPLAEIIGFLPCMYYVWCGTVRIPIPAPATERPLYDKVLAENEYPVIYGIAKRAAAQNDCHKPTRIVGIAGNSISIAIYDDCQMLYLGTTSLQLMNPEELYAVFLHEFAHARLDKEQELSGLNKHANRLPRYLSSPVDNFPFAYPDSVFALEYQFFVLAGSVLIEKTADRAMLQSTPEAAASSLLKLEYLDSYDYEDTFRDFVSVYFEEEPREQYETLKLTRFREQLAERRSFWDELIQKEMQPRNSTHPIVRDRFRALGVEAPILQDCSEDPADYTAEKEKMLAGTEADLKRNLSDSYEENRKINYLDHLQTVRDWEAAGEPLLAAEYRKVSEALCAIGQIERADALFCRAIAELPAPAAAHAMYMHGAILLHRYDEAGVDLLWRAMELNENYRDGVLDAIGQYSLRVGNQELVSTYRERGVEENQKERDYLSDLGSLRPRDKLTAESLPDGQLEADLAEMRRIGGDAIEAVYLVRKTVGEHFRSQYVVKLAANTSQEEVNRIMDGIFNYLDTVSDWPYGLFFYPAVKNIRFRKIPGSCVYQKEK